MTARKWDLRGAAIRSTLTDRPAIVAALTGVAWTLVMLGRLFIGGAIGMADQGDSRRLMCQLGVRADRPFAIDTTKYVTTTWVAHHWYGEACGADGSGEPYRSSQLWLLRLTKVLTHMFHFSGALDLRALGVLCAFVVGVAVAALVVVLPGRALVRVTIASLVGLAFADAAVAEYFISPYSEPAALLGILVLCAALVWLWRDGYSTWPGLTVVGAVATFTMTGKTQAVALLPAVLIALLWLPCRSIGTTDTEPLGVDSEHKGMRLRRPAWLSRFRAWSTVRWPALFTCTLLIVVSAVYLGSSPQRFNQVNAYDQVFLEILPHSPNPAGDLRSLGVDPSLASASGANILDPRSAAKLPEYLAFRQKVSQITILRFYTTHPDRLFSLGSQGLHAITVWRQNYLGTYSVDSGHPPGARECRVCVYTAIFSAAGHLPILIVGLWLFAIIAATRVLRDRRLNAHHKTLGRLAIIIVVAAVCEFWAVMLSEGISDLYKHMIFTNLLTALCIPALAGCLWLLRPQTGGPGHFPTGGRAPASLWPLNVRAPGITPPMEATSTVGPSRFICPPLPRLLRTPPSPGGGVPRTTSLWSDLPEFD